MPRVVVILKRVVSGITSRRATSIMYEAHTRGKAVVNSCHKELAELYEERLRERGLTVSPSSGRINQNACYTSLRDKAYVV
jgi:ATP-dependent Clp protease adaptor protein ClpS